MNNRSYVLLNEFILLKKVPNQMEEKMIQPPQMPTEELQSCSQVQVHPSLIETAEEQMPDEEILYDLAELFKVFGDSTRIKILFVLFQSEMCVCDIAALLHMTQSAISHQLRVLKQSQLVKYRREGKTVFDSLADNHVKTILGQGLDHIEE